MLWAVFVLSSGWTGAASIYYSQRGCTCAQWDHAAISSEDLEGLTLCGDDEQSHKRDSLMGSQSIQMGAPASATASMAVFMQAASTLPSAWRTWIATSICALGNRSTRIVSSRAFLTVLASSVVRLSALPFLCRLAPAARRVDLTGRTGHGLTLQVIRAQPGQTTCIRSVMIVKMVKRCPHSLQTHQMRSVPLSMHTLLLPCLSGFRPYCLQL